jgi:type IV pilus assembly protein PilY1
MGLSVFETFKWLFLLTLLFSHFVYAALPSSVADSYQLDENAALNQAAPGLLQNDTDNDGNTQTLEVSEIQGSAELLGSQLVLASGASLTVYTNGSFLYDASTSATFHALQLGETSLDTFTYSISDSDGQALASSTVTMTINGNDIDRVPLAVDDQFSVAEDSGVSQLTLLLNDAIGDPPYTIISLATGFKDPEGDEVWVECSPSPLEDPECEDETDPLKVVLDASSGTIVNRGGSNGFEVNRVICSNCVDGDSDRLFTPGQNSPEITYEPRADFNGSDTFTYTIEDVDGQQSSATVTVTVVSVNDPPNIVAGLNGTMLQGTSKTWNGRYENDGLGDFGLAARVFDKDNTIYDGLGCDPGVDTCADMQDLYFSILSATGVDTNNNNVGAIDPPYCGNGDITFTPPASFSGSVVIKFDVCDTNVCVVGAPRTSANCSFNNHFTIQVNPIDGASAGSVSEVLETDYDLADSPLEIGISATPNVLVVQDDSGSMVWDIMTDDVANSGVAAVETCRTYRHRRRTRTSCSYSKKYMHFPGNSYWNRWTAQREENQPGKGLWRIQNKDFNKIYYDPAVRYDPWVGLNRQGQPFINSVFTSAIRNPYVSGNYQTTNLSTDNLARYYVWTDVDDNSQCPDSTSIGDTVNGNLAQTYQYIDGPSPITAPNDPCTEGRLVQIKGETGASEAGAYPLGYDDGSDTYPKAETRSDCLGAGFCTLAEEKQNFANFYTFARSREFAAKSALGKVFGAAENLRVGYATLNGTNNNVPIADFNESPLTGQKRTMLQALFNTSSNGGTPLRRSLARAGEYFRCQSPNIMGQQGSPGDGPGGCPILGAPLGSCQQNYTLLITDGFWNGSDPQITGNADSDGNQTLTGSGASLFDQGQFAGCGNNSRDCNRSLADVAMYYYESDLHPLLDDDVPVTDRDTQHAPSNAFPNDKMHQHMSTFVVAFGLEDSLGSLPEDLTQSFNWGYPDTSEGKNNDLRHAALNGRGALLNAKNPTELETRLNAAFEEFSSGIGAASAVSFNSQEIQNQAIVYRAFYNIRDKTGDLIAQTFGDDGLITETLWSGAEQLDDIEPSDRNMVTFSPVDNQGVAFDRANLTADQFNIMLDANDTDIDTVQIDKRIDYFRGSVVNERPAGRFRERPSTNGRLGDIVNSAPVFVGPPNRSRRNRAPYPQGENSYESFKVSKANRASRIYVAANDGMLHVFNPATGDEVFSFISDATQTGTFNNKIKELLDFNYTHKYLVDATPALDDMFIGRPAGSSGTSSKSWRTVLVGGYGAGGKGLFALDVTDPVRMTEANAGELVYWEFTDSDDTYPVDVNGNPLLNSAGLRRRDSQATPQLVKDLGYSFSAPVLAMSNVTDSQGEREWVSIFGNGLNSTAGIAKLFVLFAARGRDGIWCHPDIVHGAAGALPVSCGANDQDFVKIDTGFGVTSSGPFAGIPNGLGAVRGIDVDSNGSVDYIYAGDAQGNFYRFDLCRADLESGDAHSGGLGECKSGTQVYQQWNVAKIFEASYDSIPQPAINKPVVINHPNEDGFIVMFGTGSYVRNSDRADSSVQSIYGLWDRLGNSVINKAQLIEQEYTNVCGNIETSSGTSFTCGRTLSSNPVVYAVPTDSADSASGVLGWYNDLDVPAFGLEVGIEFPGEKAVRNIQLRGGVAFVNSIAPRAAASCESSTGGFALAFCPSTGGGFSPAVAGYGNQGGYGNCISNGVFDLNNDGLFDSGDEIDSDIVLATRFDEAVPTDAAFFGESRVTQLSDQSLEVRLTNTSFGPNTGRLSWKRLKVSP